MIFYERFSLIVFSEVTGSRKKIHLPENSIALFLYHRWFHERTVGQSPDFPENRKRNSVTESSAGIAWQWMHFKQSFFVYYVKNREFIINPDDRMFFLFTTSPSIVDNKLRFLYILSILTVKHRLEPGVCCCCCCCLSPGGALGYFWGGYVPTGTPNWHPILKKISPKIDTPF